MIGSKVSDWERLRTLVQHEVCGISLRLHVEWVGQPDVECQPQVEWVEERAVECLPQVEWAAECQLCMEWVEEPAVECQL